MDNFDLSDLLPVANRADCKIIYADPKVSPEDLVIRDMLMCYGDCGHA